MLGKHSCIWNWFHIQLQQLSVWLTAGSSLVGAIGKGGTEIVGVPLAEVADRIKPVPERHRLIETGKLAGTCFWD
jgi:hypothetical protein